MENQSNNSQNVGLSILVIILFLLLFLSGVVIYYLYTQNKNQDVSQIEEQRDALAKKVEQLERSQESSPYSRSQESEPDIEVEEEPVMVVKDIKKPRKIHLFSCLEFGIGSYKADARCENIAKSAKKMGYDLYEIRGVVDNNPYSGLSPELKQEGLAGYRAKEGARLLEKDLPRDSIVFQGFSTQTTQKRGFEVYGYQY
ncbi:MAG: hypothetical protein ACLFQJ_05275 [Campylobacterales bacterium]